MDEQGAIPAASQRRSASTHTGAAFSLRRSAGIWFCRFVFDKSKPSNIAEGFVRIYRYVGAEGVAEFTILGFVVYGMTGKIR